jgi:hypothetical protein
MEVQVLKELEGQKERAHSGGGYAMGSGGFDRLNESWEPSHGGGRRFESGRAHWFFCDYDEYIVGHASNCIRIRKIKAFAFFWFFASRSLTKHLCYSDFFASCDYSICRIRTVIMHYYAAS